jgi:WD40 repeat protein
MQLAPIRSFQNPGNSTGFGNAWSSSGTRLAVAGYADAVFAWDVASGEQLLQAKHSGTVSCVSWRNDTQVLATGSSDGSVQLFDLSGRQLHRGGGHTDEVRSVAFSPDGRWLASGANDGTVRIWDGGNLALLGTISAHAGLVRSVAWSPDGAQLASGGHDNAVRVWQAGTWNFLGGLADHTGWIPAVCYSPDGRFLASGSMDRTVRIWDLAHQRYYRVLNTIDDWWVFGLAFSSDSRCVVVLTSEPRLAVVDIESGGIIAAAPAKFTTVAVSCSPDGSHIATTGHETQVWALTD